ncbi:TRAP transporter substrate-binding protein DctP [bacterium]|nr:TRAP transporter substrate-binding protein DctP [bacterium]
MSSLRKLCVTILVVGVIIGLNSFTTLPAAKAEKTIVLRMAYPSADRGFAPEMIKWWGYNIEERSGGKIKVEYYWGGLVGTSKEMLYAIERGVCDVGVIFPMYFEKELPLATVNTCLIGTFEDDPGITSRAWWQLASEFPEIPKEWEDHNQKLLMGWEVGAYLWMSKKPIKAFNDLKGLKCGVWGGKGPRELFKDLDSIAIAIPSVEVYDALDKGTMDARACTTPMMITYKYYEVCKYATAIGIGTAGSPVYAMSINLDTWKSIPADLRKAILDVSEDWWAYFERRVTKTQKEDRVFLKGKGMEFLEFSEADKARVRSMPVFKKYKEKYIKRVKGSTQVAEKIYNRYKELFKEHKR